MYCKRERAYPSAYRAYRERTAGNGAFWEISGSGARGAVQWVPHVRSYRAKVDAGDVDCRNVFTKSCVGALQASVRLADVRVQRACAPGCKHWGRKTLSPAHSVQEY